MSEVETTAQDTPKADVTTSTTEATPVVKTDANPEVPAEVKTETTTEQKPVAPEKYELKMPDGSQLSQERIEKVSAYAKEKGLSNEQAQEVLNRESEAVSGFFESQKAGLLARSEAWISEIKADKEFGGDKFNETVELAKRSIERFGDPELKKQLDETGLGNHPMLIKMHAKIGREMAEDRLVPSNSASTSASQRHADVLYPTMKAN